MHKNKTMNEEGGKRKGNMPIDSKTLYKVGQGSVCSVE